MSEERILEVHVLHMALPGDDRDSLLGNLEDAIDLASDQDQMTWLLDHGKRIAAIVPVEQAVRGGLLETEQSLPALAEKLVHLGMECPGMSDLSVFDRWVSRVRATTAAVAILGVSVERERARSPQT